MTRLSCHWNSIQKFIWHFRHTLHTQFLIPSVTLKDIGIYMIGKTCDIWNYCFLIHFAIYDRISLLVSSLIFWCKSRSKFKSLKTISLVYKMSRRKWYCFNLFWFVLFHFNKPYFIIQFILINHKILFIFNNYILQKPKVISIISNF